MLLRGLLTADVDAIRVALVVLGWRYCAVCGRCQKIKYGMAGSGIVGSVIGSNVEFYY
jgi:hypothetical protein